jgi:tetratricopeptide (TPR) repeat protein
MDLLDFAGEDMYFDEPVSPDVEGLLLDAARRYGEDGAEQSLLRAYFLEPSHLTVLVALYRYFYYRHRYREALIIADRAIAIVASRLDIPIRWQDLSEQDLGQSVQSSMTLTRFLLMAIKGSGYLLMRLGETQEALARFEKIAEVDTSDRLGITELLSIARSALAEDAAKRAGGKVRFLKP